MERPNRLTIVAGTVGGLALVATTVAAVALNNDPPETAEPSAAVVQQSAPLDSGSGERDDDDRESPTPVPPTESSSPANAGPSSSDAAISPEQAVAIAEQALADVPSLPPVSDIEREMEHRRLSWKVEFGDDHEVYVDAVTGEVVKVERDDDDDDDWDDDHDDDDRDDDRVDD